MAGYDSTPSQHAALADIGGVCYAALANGHTVQLYRYESHAWQPVGTALQAAQPVGAVALTHQDGAPVVAYTDMDMTATVQVLRGTSWQKAGSLSNVSDLSVQPAAGTVVVGYVTDSTCAYVTALQNNTLQEPVQWYSGLCGTPRVAGVDGRVYLAVREATNQSLVIRSWQPGGTVEPVTSPSSAAVKSADVIAYAHTLYALISDGTDHLTLSAYRDGSWQTVGTQTMDSFFAPACGCTGEFVCAVGAVAGQRYRRAESICRGRRDFSTGRFLVCGKQVGAIVPIGWQRRPAVCQL